MKLKVPFVKNKGISVGKGWCGPLALATVLKYYKIRFSIVDIAKKTIAFSGHKGAVPRALVWFALNKGLNVDYFNKYEKFKINRKEYSKRFREFLIKVDEGERDLKFKRKSEKFSTYRFIKKTPTLNDIKKYIKENKPVILHLNHAVLNNKKHLAPHYVVVVGFDRNNLYIHNASFENKAYQKVQKRIFLKAWGNEGWDKVLIIPYKD